MIEQEMYVCNHFITVRVFVTDLGEDYLSKCFNWMRSLSLESEVETPISKY